jgi:hypothetical protein
MKYGIQVTILLFITLFLGGCIETQMLVSVRPDGGGTVREQVQMRAEMVEMLQQMTMSFQEAFNGEDAEAEAQEPKDMFSEEEIRKNASKMGEGVRYLSHEMIDDGGRRGYVAIYEFDDINTVHVNQNPGASVSEYGGDVAGMEAEEEFVLFSFTPGNPARLLVRSPADNEAAESEDTGWDGDVEAENDAEEEEFGEGFDQMAEFLRDMRVLVQVAVEGENRRKQRDPSRRQCHHPDGYRIQQSCWMNRTGCGQLQRAEIDESCRREAAAQGYPRSACRSGGGGVTSSFR